MPSCQIDKGVVNLGIDSSVIEANTCLRALVNRNTEVEYWDYVKRLAAENGINPDDTTAIRKFDRHRPRKGSNQEWQNPHDPDAKIGRTKHGVTDMIYKPEAIVDLDTGGAWERRSLYSGPPSGWLRQAN